MSNAQKSNREAAGTDLWTAAEAMASETTLTEYPGETFLQELRRVSRDRNREWSQGRDPGVMFQAAELGGELGELLNVLKKVHREQMGWRGSRVAFQDVRDEIGDVLICLDIVASRYGIDLEEAARAKFNKTSEKQGFSHKLKQRHRLTAQAAREEEVRELRRWLKVALEEHDSEHGQSHVDWHWTDEARAYLAKPDLEPRPSLIELMDIRDALREYTQDGWTIHEGRWPEPPYTATHDDFDASYEGPEDGWVGNGLQVSADTEQELIEAMGEVEREHPHFHERRALSKPKEASDALPKHS